MTVADGRNVTNNAVRRARSSHSLRRGQYTGSGFTSVPHTFRTRSVHVLLKSLLLAAAGLSGLTALVHGSTWRRSRLLILCYHGVSLGDEHEASPDLYMTAGMLRRRLEHLRARRCCVLPLGEAVRRLWEGSLPPRSVALTFDDGTRDFAECAVPLLRDFAMPATVYLSTYYCGRGQPTFDPALRYLLWRGRASGADVCDLARAARPLPLATAAARQAAWDALYGRARAEAMSADDKDDLLRRLAGRLGVDYDAFLASGMFQVMSPDQVRALPRDLVDVQLHTHRHRVPHDRTAFAREIADNREHLAAFGFGGATHFCYPSGEYRGDAARWLGDLGMRSATTCVPGIATRDADPMLLPRFVDTSAVSDATFDAWLSGVADLLPRRRAYRFDPARLRPAPSPSRHGLGLPAQEVHQHELAERHRTGEVRLAARDLAHPLHELHERAVAGEHERVDHDPRAPAVGDFLERLA